MKPLILLLSLWMQTAAAQQLALLDRRLKEPFVLRDSFTLQDVAGGAFPLYTEDIPVVIGQLQTFARNLASPEVVQHTTTETFATPHAQIFLSRRKGTYSCVLQSRSRQFSVPMVVGRGTRKSTLKEITRFVEYLRQNKAVATALEQ